MSSVVTERVPGAAFPQALSTCLEKLNAEPWLATLAVRVGDWHVGVRVNSPEARDLVESTLASVRVPADDDKVNPNLSVEIDRSTSRRLQLVYRDHEIVARRRDAADLRTDLPVLLDDLARIWSTDRLALNLAAVHDAGGRTVLLPARYHPELLVRRRQLEAAGLSLVSSRVQLLDPPSGDLVLDLQDEDLRGLLPEGSRPRGGLSPVSLLLKAGDEQRALVRPAESVQYLASSVINRTILGMGPTLHGLAQLTPRVQTLALPNRSFRSATLASEVVALLS